MSTNDSDTSQTSSEPVCEITHPNGDLHEFSSWVDAMRHQVEQQLQPPVETNPFGEILRSDDDITIHQQTARLDPPDSRYQQELMYEYTFAIPTYNSIHYLSHVDKIVEVGAGKGYWAWLLEQVGIDIIAFDDNPVSDNDVPNEDELMYYPPMVKDSYDELFATVCIGDAHHVHDHPDRALFLCWPPGQTDMAYEAVRDYHLSGGDTVLYIGEGPGGTHGTTPFFQYLNAEFQYVRSVHNLSWTGYCDSLHVYTTDGSDLVGDDYEPPYYIDWS